MKALLSLAILLLFFAVTPAKAALPTNFFPVGEKLWTKVEDVYVGIDDPNGIEINGVTYTRTLAEATVPYNFQKDGPVKPFVDRILTEMGQKIFSSDEGVPGAVSFVVFLGHGKGLHAYAPGFYRSPSFTLQNGWSIPENLKDWSLKYSNHQWYFHPSVTAVEMEVSTDGKTRIFSTRLGIGGGCDLGAATSALKKGWILLEGEFASPDQRTWTEGWLRLWEGSKWSRYNLITGDFIDSGEETTVSMVLDTNGISVLVTGTPGSRAILERAPSLDWTDISSEMVELGPTGQVLLPQPRGGTKFFRIRPDTLSSSRTP